MVFISKNDKKTWEEYVVNFGQFILNIEAVHEEKEIKTLKKDLIQVSVSSNSYKLFKKGKIQPDGIIDLH